MVAQKAKGSRDRSSSVSRAGVLERRDLGPRKYRNRPINLTNNSVTDYAPDWQPLVN